MAKYIDADALLAQMKDRRFYVGRRSDPICIIEDAPAADVEPKQRWIPVTEKTPEGRQYVLCCGAKGGMFVGWVCDYHERDNGKATAFLHGGRGRKITHWMPLPEPPKGEDEDEGVDT